MVVSLKNGAQVEVVPDGGTLDIVGRNERESILLDAARKGQLRLVKRLVGRHFKVSVQTTPELLASLASIACGAGPRGAMADETSSTLLSHGVDINAIDGACHTALTRAILFHRTKCVKYILKKGADPLCENSNPLLFAAHSSLEKLETLLQAIDIHAVSPQELRERITGCQHSSAWDQKMGAVKVFERFLVKVNAELGSVWIMLDPWISMLFKSREIQLVHSFNTDMRPRAILSECMCLQDTSLANHNGLLRYITAN